LTFDQPLNILAKIKETPILKDLLVLVSGAAVAQLIGLLAAT